jgi:hypothetical protein
MVGIEALLTKLEVSPSGELVAGFRNLGEMNFPAWLNTFCIKFGRKWEPEARKALKKTKECLSNSSSVEISGAVRDERRSRVFSKDWLVYQMDLPVSSKSALPKEFVRGNYTKGARFKLKSSWHYVNLPTNLQTSLLAKNQITRNLAEVQSGLRKLYSKSSASRKFNVLANKMRAYDGSNNEKVIQGVREQSAGKIPTEIFEQMFDIQREILITNSVLDSEGEISYNIKGNNVSGVKLNANNWDFLRRGRMITLEELMSEPLLFLDIEIPGFRGENPLISWIGSGLIRGEDVKYSIDTIYKLGIQYLENFAVRSHSGEPVQIDSFARWIHQINPLLISAHNSNFDLKKLEGSSAGFPIGEDGSPPLYKVTTPFFERLGVRDRFVLDTMRWQKVARAYDINAKLEMMVGMKKSISYDEMEKLEEGTLQDKLEIANYLTQDIRAPVEGVLLSDDFRKNIRDLLFIAEWSNVSPERLLHSPKCVNEAQERVYFEELGTYREEIPPNQKTKQMQKKRTRARNAFQKLVIERGVDFEEQKGLFTNVVKAYIPIGNIMRDLVSHRFPQAQEFYQYRDQHKSDKQRLFFIEQYSSALSGWMVESYGEHLTELKKFKDLMGNLPFLEFQQSYKAVKASASEDNPDYRRSLSEGRLSMKGLERSLSEFSYPFIRKHGLTKDRFLILLNSFSRKGRITRRLIGNFDVFPDKMQNCISEIGERPLFINDILRSEFGRIHDFLSENNISILAQEGHYLYLNGEKGPIYEENCPLVAVDEIPLLYVADNPYYKKNGYYAHLKVSDDPTFNMSVFEMKNFQPILDCLLGGDSQKAKEIYARARDTLEQGNISGDELIFYNKSREKYSIFSNGEDFKTYFVESDSSVPENTEILLDGNRRYFVEEGGEQRIYIMSRQESIDFLDREAYFKRFVDKGRKMLGPVLKGRKKEKFNAQQGLLQLI